MPELSLIQYMPPANSHKRYPKKKKKGVRVKKERQESICCYCNCTLQGPELDFPHTN